MERTSGNAVRAQKFLDAISAGIGLPSFPAYLDNIYNDWRLELTFEEDQFFELARIGKAVSIFGSVCSQSQKSESLAISLIENEVTEDLIKQNLRYNWYADYYEDISGNVYIIQ